jgi:hypothetical protein
VNNQSVRYYLQRHGRVEGPFTVDEINSRIAAGLVDSHWRATADLGESLERIGRTSERDWFPVGEIPHVAGRPKEQAPPKETSFKSVLFVVLLALILFALLFGFLRLKQMFRW